MVDALEKPIADVTISAGAGHITATDAKGNYTLSSLAAGTYTLTPSKSGYTFSPPSVQVDVPPDKTGINFVSSQANIGPDLAIANFTISTYPADSNPMAWQENHLRLTIVNAGTDRFVPQNSDYSVILTVKDAQGKQVSHFEYSSDKFSSMDKLPNKLDPDGEIFTPQLPSIFFLAPVAGGTLELSLVLHDTDPNLTNNSQTKQSFTIDPSKDTPQNCRKAILNAMSLLGIPTGEAPQVAVDEVKLFTLDIPNCKGVFTCEGTEMAKFIAGLKLPIVGIISSLKDLVTQPPETCTSILDYINMILTQLIQQGVSVNIISIEFPAYPLVTNSQGQRAGFLDDGTVVQEISDVQVINSHEKKIVLFPASVIQALRIKATGSGMMRLRLAFARDEGTALNLDYQEVSLVADTVGWVDIQDRSYVLNLDDNKDGIPDRRKLPDTLVVSGAKNIYLPIIEHN